MMFEKYFNEVLKFRFSQVNCTNMYLLSIIKNKINIKYNL